MDTGSDITWIPCKPCDNCFTKDRGVAIFDPRKSSSYVKIGCEDPFCSGYVHGSLACDEDGIYCRYGQSYSDQTLSIGILSIDNFSFLDGTRPHGKMKIQLAFGCGHYINKPNIPGVFGLNQEALSFLTQKGIERFSHCFIPIGYQQPTLIRFGQDAIITNETTPMVEFGDKPLPGYYVSLEGISVGRTRLNIPQGTFKTSERGDRGVIIDTGSTNTYLARDAYDLLLAELKKQIILTKEKLPELCYLVTTMEELLNGIPKITYHFSGLNHTLQGWNAWSAAIVGEKGITACLMFKRATLDLTVIGFQHLQNVNVGYDLRNKVISLQSGDCTKD